MTRTTSPQPTGPQGTGSPAKLWQLRTSQGRVVLVDSREHAELTPEHLDLPPMLVQALHEWASVAERVTGGDDGAAEAARMVSRRGRQLAARLAVEAGAEIDYPDPLTGDVERISGERVMRSAALAQRRRGGIPAARQGAHGGPARESTPWATGLTVSGIIAAIVTICLVVVTTGLAEVNVFLAVAVNIAVAAGFAPSIWMGRRVLLWRWVALGTVGGIVIAWFALLLGLLG